jgi:hydroxymethylbilane synthase
MRMMVIRIGTRGSDLARWQAQHVADLLRGRWPDLEVAIRIITTTGDRVLDVPLAEIGGKGLFTKEIEDALLGGAVDLAVHSLKDLPTELPDGLALGAVLARHDPLDALIAAPGSKLASLAPGARVGTSSLRRRAQILHARPDLDVVSVRGNVPTRLRRVDEGAYDAVILARAGVERLGYASRIQQILPPEVILPAPGQGALGIEIRAGDERILSILTAIEDRDTRWATDAERAFLGALGGGCQVPVGALAVPDPASAGSLRLEGLVAAPDGSRLLRGVRTGHASDGPAIGRDLAADLVARGAAEILRAARSQVSFRDPA